MGSTKTATRIVTGAPAPVPAPEPEKPEPQFAVNITLTETIRSGACNSIQAGFLIEAQDAATAATEANRLAADFAAAVPFIPKEYQVKVSPFRR